MRIPDLESMIKEEESKVEFVGYIGFNGDLIEVDEEGNHVVTGRIDTGKVSFFGFKSYSIVHGHDSTRL